MCDLRALGPRCFPQTGVSPGADSGGQGEAGSRWREPSRPSVASVTSRHGMDEASGKGSGGGHVRSLPRRLWPTETECGVSRSPCFSREIRDAELDTTPGFVGVPSMGRALRGQRTVLGPSPGHVLHSDSWHFPPKLARGVKGCDDRQEHSRTQRTPSVFVQMRLFSYFFTEAVRAIATLPKTKAPDLASHLKLWKRSLPCSAIPRLRVKTTPGPHTAAQYGLRPQTHLGASGIPAVVTDDRTGKWISYGDATSPKWEENQTGSFC